MTKTERLRIRKSLSPSLFESFEAKKVKRLNDMINAITKGGMLKNKYMCGLVNGLRLAVSEMDGSEPVFERLECFPD